MKSSKISNTQAQLNLIPLDFKEYSVEEVKSRALVYYENMKSRRTVRNF